MRKPQVRASVFTSVKWGQEYNHLLTVFECDEVYEVISMVPTQSRGLANDGFELLMTVTKTKLIVPLGTCILLTLVQRSVGRSRL